MPNCSFSSFCTLFFFPPLFNHIYLNRWMMLHLWPIVYDGLRHCVSIFDIYAVRFSLIFYLNHKSLLKKKNRTFLYYRYLLINKAELCLKRSSFSYIEKSIYPSIHPSIYLFMCVRWFLFVRFTWAFCWHFQHSMWMSINVYVLFAQKEKNTSIVI